MKLVFFTFGELEAMNETASSATRGQNIVASWVDFGVAELGDVQIRWMLKKKLKSEFL